MITQRKNPNITEAILVYVFIFKLSLVLKELFPQVNFFCFFLAAACRLLSFSFWCFL